ncbi:hypothetical protein CR513_06880, partial [Mucuna pruriens]
MCLINLTLNRNQSGSSDGTLHPRAAATAIVTTVVVVVGLALGPHTAVCNRYGYLYLIHEKSQSLNVFKSFKAKVELQLGKKIKAIKSYHGGEYYGRYDRSGEQRLGPFALLPFFSKSVELFHNKPC